MKRLLLGVALLLAACSEPQPCKFAVGDAVVTVASERFVVDRAEPGVVGGREPAYRITSGKGWRIGLGLDGVRMGRGTYWVRESEIKLAEVPK